MEHLWSEFWDIFRHGLDQISNSNPIVGVVIALLGGLMARNFLGIFFISVFAVILHIAADIVIPMVMNHAPFHMPHPDNAFLEYAGTLYVAYFFVILVIYGVKRIFASVRG